MGGKENSNEFNPLPIVPYGVCMSDESGFREWVSEKNVIKNESKTARQRKNGLCTCRKVANGREVEGVDVKRRQSRTRRFEKKDFELISIYHKVTSELP